MKLVNSSKAKSLSLSNDLRQKVKLINKNDLINFIKEIAIPRHFTYNRENNENVAEYIFNKLKSFGYETEFQGVYSNVVAFNPNTKSKELILIGAHYDSVPNCPGADDNASAVVAMLACAKAVPEIEKDLPICFVAFNCEEDGLLGSFDFVKNYLGKNNFKIKQVHILEMVGYATDEPNSQNLPTNLPIKIPNTGNFLGILGNRDSHKAVDEVLSLGKTYLSELPVIGLKIYLGAEKLFPDLGRSDHLPFWEKQIPAIMWTDTAEFRNPNYHKQTDTPNTLNYDFLRKVSQLLLLQVLQFKS